jgi:hypothetical protein
VTGGARLLAACLAVVALAAARPACAQLSVPAKGTGAMTFQWQTVTDHYHLNGHGDRVDAGHITAHTALLRVDYGVTERMALTFAAPYVAKKYVGPFPHNPDPFNDDDGDHEHIGTIDDGDYHSGWQDFTIGARWRWLERPWLVTPFVNYSWPSHDYVWFAHSALGSRQKRLQLGIAAGRQFGPLLTNLYVQGSYSYTFVEPVLGIDVDYSTLNGEVGWFFNPTFSMRALVTYRKTHGGLDFPFDFPPPRDTELFLHHDQVQRVDYVNYGIGAKWRVGARTTIDATWMTTYWGENGHAIHNSVTLAVTRSF